jgi:hypothetical protein
MKTKEEVNKYYELVNQYIDSYIDEWNIKPSRLRKYLSKNKVKNFLEKNGLNDIKFIDRVLNDIIGDRVSMEMDQVLTFESFLLESITESDIDIYHNIPNAGLEHEKFLADIFDTSLSSINATNPSKHIFNVDGIVSDSECIVFIKSDMDAITENLKEMVKESIKDTKIDVDGFSMSLNIMKFVDVDKLEQYITEVLTNEKVVEVLKSMLGCSEVKKTENGFIGIDPRHKNM